jgi:Protein of unknown function (DUF1569)
MSLAIETGKVIGRRHLHFTSLDDIVADVDQLANAKEIRCLGNWSGGQVLRHLTTVMNGSIDGMPRVMPGFLRFILRLVMKKRFLNKPMPPGFRLPKSGAALLPAPTSWDEGLQGFRQAARRLQTETIRQPHPVLGPLTVEEWTKVHCRHSELHLSFLMPDGTK